MKTTNSKYKLQHGLMNLNCLMDYIQDYFGYIIEKHDMLLGSTVESLTDNPEIRLYVANIENRITFKNNSE